MNKLNNNEALQMNTVMPTMKKSLLALAVAGTMAMSGAYAASVLEPAGATPALATAMYEDGSDVLINATATNDIDYGKMDTNVDEQTYDSADINHDATFYIYDSAAPGTGTFTITGDTDVAAGKNLAFILGESGAGTSTVSVSANFGTITTNVTGSMSITTAAASTSTITFNGGADLGTGTVTLANALDTLIVADAGTLVTTGGIDGGSAGVGILTIQNQTDVAMTIAGAVGSTNSLAAVNVTSTANTVTFNNAVNATTITLTGVADDDETAFQGDVTGDIVLVAGQLVTFTADEKLVGNITTTDGAGILTFALTGTDTTLVSGNVGVAGTGDLAVLNVTPDEDMTATFGGTVNALAININDVGTVAFTNDVTTAELIAVGDATITMASDMKFVGSIDTDTGASEGTFTFAATGTDTVLVSGTVGNTQAVKVVNVAPAAGVTATFADAYEAVTTNHTGTGTVAFSGTATGIIKIEGGGTVTGAEDITGTVDNTSGTDGSGTLTMAATKDVSGAIGATNSLLAVNSDSTGGTSAFGGAISATTVSLAGTGTTTFAGDVTGAVNFTADGTATVAQAIKIVGAVTTATTNTGTLNLSNTTNAAITLASSTIGASNALLKAVNVTNGDPLVTTLAGNIFATTVTATATANLDKITFAGTVNGTTLNVAGAGQSTFSKDINADVVFADSVSTTGSATVAANQKIVGAVTTATTDKGILTFAATTANTTLASSTIGATGALLKEVNVTSTANTATLAGNVFATAVNATATDTTGSDKVAFNGTVNTGTLTLAGTGSFSFDDIVTTTSDLDIVAGAKIVLTDGIVAGDTVFAATQNDTALTTSAVVTMPETLNSGSINFIDYVGSGNTGAADAALLTVNNTTLATFAAAVGSDATIVKITATKKSAATIASELNITTNQASALDNAVTALASGDATGLSAMQTALATGVTESNVEQMQPDAGAATGAAMAVTGGVNNVIAGRQADTRVAFNTLGKQSGVSTGDAANDAVVWAQVFTSDATQDRVGSIDGYDADNQGLVIGWEAEKAGSTLGLSLSYSDTDVDGKSAAASHTDTTAAQVSVYGNNGEQTDWMIAYASADNDTKRTINFGGLNRTAAGNYNSDIIMAKAGHSFTSTKMGGFTLTPKADLSWTHISNDGYTETGATDLNLIVASSTNDVVTARAGAEFAQRFESNGAVTIPRVSIMGGYDLKNDRAETTSTFTGGGSSFTTQGIDPEKASLALGFGVDHVSDDSTASFDFNADIKDGYSNNTASLTLKSKF